MSEMDMSETENDDDWPDEQDDVEQDDLEAEGGESGDGTSLTLKTTAPVAGGAALARDDDGRVVFVSDALPGETVEVAVIEAKKDFARARIIRVIDASPDRIEPVCRFVAGGCGGCDLQHVRPEAQPLLKQAIVIDALKRLGRVAEPTVEVGPPLAPLGFRTTVRCAVVDGKAGFRMAKSHDVIEVDHCLVAHPRIDALIAGGLYEGVDEVTFRYATTTGEGLVIAAPHANGVDLPEGDDDFTVVGTDMLTKGSRAWIHEEINGVRLRVSAHSFFQSRPDGAEALVATVRELGGPELAGAGTVIDAYAGVGLFAATVTPVDAKIFAVESGHSSAADARQNLAEREAKVIRSTVERWSPSRADVVIADPARTGLGRKAVEVLAGTHAGVIVLVSCDAASLGRDARLLADQGYALERSVLVDLFPQTHHVEVVSRFFRES